MKRIYIFGLILAILALLVAFAIPSKPKSNKKNMSKETLVTITTNMGEIKIKLYDETPLHRDNFIKLAESNFYDSLLFHRVIENFMIQCGDPKSKGAAQGVQLGFGGPGYTIPAEFNTQFIHKKGAVAAARLGGPQNPDKESSGSQFYIVVGSKVPAASLKQLSENKAIQAQQEFINNQLYKPENRGTLDSLINFQKMQDRDSFMAKYEEFSNKFARELKELSVQTYTDEQIAIYDSIGGTPHLDMDYTVFGEVVEGLNVVDSIAKVATDQANRPLDDVVITKVSVEK